MAVELLAIVRHDADRFLSPVLQGVQTERCVCSGIDMTVDAEQSTFLMGMVVILKIINLLGHAGILAFLIIDW